MFLQITVSGLVCIWGERVVIFVIYVLHDWNLEVLGLFVWDSLQYDFTCHLL